VQSNTTSSPKTVSTCFVEVLRTNIFGRRFIVAVASALLFGSIFWQAGRRRSTVQDLANIFGEAPTLAFAYFTLLLAVSRLSALIKNSY